MAEPVDMILPMLKEIRADIASLHKRFDGLEEKMSKRFDEIEKTQKGFKQALSADSLMTRLITGEFEERIENVEKYNRRIEKLEEQVRAFEGRS